MATTPSPTKVTWVPPSVSPKKDSFATFGAEAVGDEANPGGAARGGRERRAAAALVEQTEAASVTAGNDSDEVVGGEVARVGQRDRAGGADGARRRCAELGRIRGAGDDRLAADTGERGGGRFAVDRGSHRGGVGADVVGVEVDSDRAAFAGLDPVAPATAVAGPEAVAVDADDVEVVELHSGFAAVGQLQRGFAIVVDPLDPKVIAVRREAEPYRDTGAGDLDALLGAAVLEGDRRIVARFSPTPPG